MRRFVTVLVVGLLATALRADDGPITIKVKKSVVGDVVKETKTDTTTNKLTFTDNGMEKTVNESVVTKFVYTEEVVTKAAGAKHATKLKRVYETADLSRNGEKDDLGLAGKTVMIEKSGDKYAVTMDGKELTGPAAAILNKEFAKEKEVDDEDLLPKDPVKVGGTWKVDVAKLAKDASGELDIDVAKSSATGKLMKVYDKGGRKFGVMEITMELALNKIGPEGMTIELKAGSMVRVTAQMDACIDGSKNSATGKVTIKGEFSGTANGIDLKFELSGLKEGGGEEVEKK